MKLKSISKVLSLAAVSLVFFGCAQVEDPEGAIKGSGKDYTVEYTNEGTTVYRAYKSTATKHESCTVKITFQNQKTGVNATDGVMGVMFDFRDAANKSVKGNDFCVVGVRYLNGKWNYYVSKFANITDIQAENFGATPNATGTAAIETVVKNFTDATAATTPAANGDVSVYVHLVANDDGSYTVQLFGAESFDSSSNFIGADALSDKITISSSVTGKSAKSQELICVYANVTAGKTLKGAWDFVKWVGEAEEFVEE